MVAVKRYAVIDEITGKVVNVVMWDGVTPWSPPAGTRAKQSDAANVEPVDGGLVISNDIESRLAALEQKMK